MDSLNNGAAGDGPLPTASWNHSEDREKEHLRARVLAEELVEHGLEVCRANRLDPRLFWVVVATKASDMAGLANQAGQYIPSETTYEVLSDVEGLRPLSDSEAELFGGHLIPFGKHKGSRYRDLPLSYLEWLSYKVLEDYTVCRYFEWKRKQEEGFP